MNPRSVAIIGVLLSAGVPSLLSASDPTPSDEMETVLVAGEQPGPGLWKVSRDGHSLWIFGTIGEIPRSLDWRTQELEARIAESKEVIYPGRARECLGARRPGGVRPMLSVVDKDPREDCEMAAFEAIMNRPTEEVPEALRTGFNLIKKQADLQVEAAAEAERAWVDAMEEALARNDSTVAVVPIWLAWNPTVYVGRLRAKGYAVEDPR